MALYRLLLRLFPKDFRERFGRDMTEVFEDRWRIARRRGARATTRLWMRAVSDITAAACRERLAGLGTALPTPTGGRFRMLKNDIAHALRLISRRRAFSLTVMITIGLGIGATTSLFSVANALVLRALPFAHADRLVHLYEHQDQEGFSGNLALGNLDDWCAAPGLDGCGAYSTTDLNLTGGDTPDRVHSAAATPGLFGALSIQPLAGRVFTADEAARKDPVVLVAQPAVARLFGGAAPVGRTIMLDGVRHDVVGVLPEMPGLDDIALWRPAATQGQSRGNHANRAIARLRDGVTIEQVQAQLHGISLALQTEHPETNTHWWGEVEPLQASMTENVTTVLSALGGLTGVLLLLCAVSAASLLASRSAARDRELSVRLALGASRGSLIVQLFIESVALALGGAILGAILATWTIADVIAVLPPRLTLWRTPGPDAWMFAFATMAALTMSVIFGLIPAVGVSRRSTAAGASRGRATEISGHRLRAGLTVAQTGLATVLLIAAALLGTVMVRVLFADPGFDTSNILTFSVTPPRAAYADAASLTAFYDRLNARIRRLPQVAAFGAAMNPPMSGSSVTRGVIKIGEPPPARGHARLVLFQAATPGYVRALGLRILEGREFSDDDSAAAAPVALVNARLASALWPGESAIGKQILVHTDETVPRTVVGVLVDAKQARADRATAPEYYVPVAQSPRRTLTYVLRLDPSAGALSRQTLQAEVAAVDPSLPLYDLATMDSAFNRSESSRAAVTKLAMSFGGAALLFAATGLFGLVGSSVTERTREIGIRLALGARPSSVMRLVSRRGMLMAGVGVALGLGTAVPVTRLLKDLLTDTPPSQPAVWGIVAMALLIVAAVACWIPARAAIRVDPSTSLRSE